MADKLTARSLESRAKRKGRYSDGDGLFLRVMTPAGRPIGSIATRSAARSGKRASAAYPGMSLADARIKHADLRAAVLKGVDLIGDQRKAARPSRLRAARRRSARSLTPMSSGRRDAANWARTRSIGGNGAPRWPVCPLGSAISRSIRSARNRCSMRSTRSGRERRRPAHA